MIHLTCDPVIPTVKNSCSIHRDKLDWFSGRGRSIQCFPDIISDGMLKSDEIFYP